MSTFWQQLKALLKRNFLLKKRIKKNTLQEFIFPIYFVVLLFLTSLGIPTKEKPALPEFPEHSITNASFSPYGKLLVSPNTSDVKSLMQNVLDQLPSASNLDVNYFGTPDEVEKEYRFNQSGVSAGIHFDDDALSVLSYTVRVPYSTVPSSAADNLYTWQGGCRDGDGLDKWSCPVNSYLYSGFVQLQMAIDTALLRLMTNNPNLDPPVLTIQMMPKPSHPPDISVIQILSSIYYVMAYSPFIASLSAYLVAEKEKKIKESMKMMGLRDSAFWLSWVIVYSVIIFIVTVIVTLLALAFSFFHKSNLFIFFILLFLYGMSIISMAFMITPFFTKAETAGFVSSFGTMLISLLYLSVSLTREGVSDEGPVSSIPSGGQWALSLLSPVALALGVDQLIYQDLMGGSNWNRLDIGQFPVYASMIMLALDTILYGLLAVWLDNVVPNEYGLRRPPWFCFLPSYWQPKQKNMDEMHDIIVNAEANGSVNVNMPRDAADVEPPSTELQNKDVLRIFNISKTFKAKGKKKLLKAVDGISLDLYEGQITALLGHNGAGKTTLINMLIGMSPPSDGTATIYGLDVSDSNDMTQLRSMTGVCPQGNVLLDDLTCRENLEVYAALRGMEPGKIASEIETVMADLGMMDQIDTWAKDLSGGQKRKLNVGIAIIGDPKVVFLDEPTAGMDPSSRRHLWSVLKAKKKDRLILLTTHFMDEADILADRKAFISRGRLRCAGSSLFLKNKFGVGYHLSLVVEPSSDENGIVNLVTEHIGEVAHRRHGKELVFTLPLETVSQFKDLFIALEASSGEETVAESLGIKTYGVSMTSLEEVFLKLEAVENQEDDEADTKEPLNILGGEHIATTPLSTTMSIEETDRNGGIQVETVPDLQDFSHHLMEESGALSMQRYMALLKIRFLFLIRNKQRIFWQIILPVVLALVGAWLTTEINQVELLQPQPLAIEPTPYITGGPPLPKQTKLAYAISDGGSRPGDFVTCLENRSIETDHLPDLDHLNETEYNLAYNIYNITNSSENLVTRLAMVYNDSALHILPVSINLVTSAMLKLLLPSSSPINTTSLPFPDVSGTAGYNNGLFVGVLLLGFAMSVVPVPFAIYLVIERQRKLRAQLRIAGVSQTVYWLSGFMADFLQFSIIAILSIISLLIFQVESVMTGGAILCIIILYLLCMPVNILVAYCLSFGFEKYETAAGVIGNVFTNVAYLPFMAVSMVDMLADTSVATILHIVFLFIDPPYCVFGGLYYINKVYQTAAFQTTGEPDIPISAYFAWDANIDIVFIAAILHIGLLFLLLLILDVRNTGGDARDVFTCGKSRHYRVSAVPEENSDVPEDEDVDVAEERRRVENWDRNKTSASKQPVGMVKNLRKVFVKSGRNCCSRGKAAEEKYKVAVRNNTFAVDAGEVFGLLGPNGAGKTTTLNMMMAEVAPTKGRVYVGGHDIRSSLSEAFQSMSSCPQHDALWDDITLIEHIECFAALRGLYKSDIPKITEFFLTSLKIEEHAKKLAKNLSGGTKRKTSYVISMMGKPNIVLLDEPSTGMDPQSKRFLWDTISSSFNNDQRGAILTTHYMEEADALCSRVGIMVNGQMECLGATQHLKNKFGNGYVLEVKLKVTNPSSDELEVNMDALTKFVKDNFPEAVSVECFGERAVFRIPSESIKSLAHTFMSLEEGKEQYNIEEYSFSQATLEQVFLEFARHQLEEGQETDQEHQEAAQRTRSTIRRQTSNTSA